MIQPFVYHNTTKLIFGEGQISALTEEIPGGRKILVLYGGGSIKKTGIYDQVTAALKGQAWEEMGGIEPNPHYETCMKAVERIKKEGFNYLLAVGGGSVIDATKFIAAAALYTGGDPWQIMTDQLAIDNMMDYGVVLTIPATGSETNFYGVIMRGSDKLATGAFHRPNFAILDPGVCKTLPKRQIQNGIVDAFIHVTEQYLTHPVEGVFQDRFSEALLLTLIEEAPKILQNPQDLAAQANFMLVANMALNGLISSGVPQDWATHMIGHELTGNFGIDHGRSLTIVLPALLARHLEEKKAKLAQMAERIFGCHEGSQEERARQAIKEMISFFRSVGVPVCLHDYDSALGAKEVELAIASLKAHGNTALGEHGNINLGESKEILLLALDGPEGLL